MRNQKAWVEFYTAQYCGFETTNTKDARISYSQWHENWGQTDQFSGGRASP